MPSRLRTERQLVVPQWAQHFKVSQTGSELVVSGWGVPFDLIEREFSDGQKDILEGLEHVRQLPGNRVHKAAHFLFAAADTLEKQVEFIHTFGPVLASDMEYPDRDPNELFDYMESGKNHPVPEAIAYQKLVVLDIERRLFALILELTITVNKLRDWAKSAIEEEKKYTAHFHGGPQIAIPETRPFLDNRELASDKERSNIEELRRLLPEIQDLFDSYPSGALANSANLSSGKTP